LLLNLIDISYGNYLHKHVQDTKGLVYCIYLIAKNKKGLWLMEEK